MNTIFGFLFVIISSLFLFIGCFFAFFNKNHKKVITFSISMGIVVLSFLAIVHIAPETIELIQTKFQPAQAYAYIFLLTIAGYFILKILDKFLPDHHGHNDDNKHKHIAIITTISLMIHNFIESMSLYLTTAASTKSGLIFMLGISIHNIALSIMLCGIFYKNDKDKTKTIKMLFWLFLAGIIGALCAFTFNLEENFILGSLLAVTLGMILYIIIFEFLPELKNNKDKQSIIYGLLIGFIIMIITMLF